MGINGKWDKIREGLGKGRSQQSSLGLFFGTNGFLDKGREVELIQMDVRKVPYGKLLEKV